MKPVSSGRRQVPPRQTRLPEQSVAMPPGPLQHGLSISPHAVAGSVLTQVAVVTSQASIREVQGLAPSQHAPPAPPHPTHIPSRHTTSSRHVKPSQQRCPGRPHVAGSVSTSSAAAQTPSRLQRSPMQQSDDPVHDAVRGAQQRPASHARPRQQSDAASQAAPDPAWTQQTSPRPHSSPSSQIRPMQQPPPAVPHAAVGPGPEPSRRMVPSIPVEPSGVAGFVAHPETSATTPRKRTGQESCRMGPC